MEGSTVHARWDPSLSTVMNKTNMKLRIVKMIAILGKVWFQKNEMCGYYPCIISNDISESIDQVSMIDFCHFY